MFKLNKKNTERSIDLKNLTGSGFQPYQVLKKIKDKEVFPDKKFLLDMKRDDICYFYCKAEKVNFPVYMSFINKKVVMETIVSFRRERPKKEHAEIISRNNFIEIKFPYKEKVKKHLKPSGIMLKIENELNPQAAKEDNSMQKDAENMKMFQARQLKEKT